MSEDVGNEMSILFDLWLVNHLISGALDDVLAGSGGLNGDEFGFYSLLRRFGPATGRQVTGWTAMPATTISSFVRRLQQRGHVEQRANPEDGRSRLLSLTPAGEQAHAATAETFFGATRTLSAALGPDEYSQRTSLQRLDTALRQVGGLDPRPYRVNLEAQEQVVNLSYSGPQLSGDEEAQVRHYIQFLRSQREVSSQNVPHNEVPRTT